MNFFFFHFARWQSPLWMLNIIAHIELFYVSLLLFQILYTNKYICASCEKHTNILQIIEKLSSIHLYCWMSSYEWQQREEKKFYFFLCYFYFRFPHRVQTNSKRCNLLNLCWYISWQTQEFKEKQKQNKRKKYPYDYDDCRDANISAFIYFQSAIKIHLSVCYWKQWTF